MDLQFWIWLIAIVAMFLARAMRKAPKGPETPDRPTQADSDDDSSGNKPMTFEELLREIQQAKTPPRPAPPAPEIQTRPTYKSIKSIPEAKSYDVDYDEEIEEEEKDLETIPRYGDDRATEIYETAKREAFQRKSLEETMKLEDTVVKFSHFKGYDEAPKQSVANDILKEFKDPEGFKKAFIMSEILKRKF